MRQAFKLKTDRYRRARGGWARFYDLSCSACGQHLLLYQKDGKGTFVRLYVDRIMAPEELSDGQAIRCSGCNALIGTRYRYDKEPRDAFLLVPGSITKKIAKGIYSPVERKIQK